MDLYIYLDCFQKEEFHFCVCWKSTRQGKLRVSLSLSLALSAFNCWSLSLVRTLCFRLRCIYVFIGIDTVY